ncbi:cation diffusion facilitator family transporter [Lacibacterium aquatile]|uniref:Cation diffusion facilitator family transporter n=1 Tax=Lacibacterium aquatile TaxID=1168082 RepID=A0ABW5DKB0_9PROT
MTTAVRSATLAERNRLTRIAAQASVTVALILVTGNAFAYLQTGSVAVLSALVDSALDVGASLMNAAAIWYSHKPPDAEHRFGHGKVEALAGLGQASLIGGSAVFLLTEAVQRVIAPQTPVSPEVGIAMAAFALIITGGLVAFQSYVMKRTQSVAVAADSLHYRSDLLLNGGVILALSLSHFIGWPYFDPLFACLTGALVLKGAASIVVTSANMLMDRELPEAVHNEIVSLVTATPGVLGVHDIRTRGAGPDTFIQLHLELPDEMKLIDAHVITDDVEARLHAAFPGAHIITHQDPHGVVMKARAGKRELP